MVCGLYHLHEQTKHFLFTVQSNISCVAASGDQTATPASSHLPLLPHLGQCLSVELGVHRSYNIMAMATRIYMTPTPQNENENQMKTIKSSSSSTASLNKGKGLGLSGNGGGLK